MKLRPHITGRTQSRVSNQGVWLQSMPWASSSPAIWPVWHDVTTWPCYLGLVTSLYPENSVRNTTLILLRHWPVSSTVLAPLGVWLQSNFLLLLWSLHVFISHLHQEHSCVHHLLLGGALCPPVGRAKAPLPHFSWRRTYHGSLVLLFLPPKGMVGTNGAGQVLFH